MLRTVFDVPALRARQSDLEQVAAQPDFWNDQQKAQKEMRQLDEVKEQINKSQLILDKLKSSSPSAVTASKILIKYL